MKTKLVMAAVLLAAAALATGTVVIASYGMLRIVPLGERRWDFDVTKLPGHQDSRRSHKRRICWHHFHGLYGKRRQAGILPVTGPDGQLVGYIGHNGFWALGKPEPVLEGAYTVIEEFDESGEQIGSRTIYP